ncbi:MAG: MBL fold metallo-hydrolase [Xanthobacteraceae bacterium]|nr:MAG: MBL fold metallo-hydrolase [Xanthobacteraceae bacterium]
MKLTFLGGVGTVTGSKFLLEASGARLLVDCGLFQGFKQLRLRNWNPLPINPASIDAVILTHAHLDHSGYLPLLMRNGFRGPVIATPATRDLCGILLPDSGYLQEKDAEFANRHGFSKHHPALPLYTAEDGERVLRQFRPVPFDTPHRVAGDVELTFRPGGHILGAAIVELTCGGRRLVFSGDLGRPNDPVMMAPAHIVGADDLVVESTYGDRVHNGEDASEALLAVIARTIGRGGTVVIPAFAVGRTQAILYHLHQLRAAGRLPLVPVFLDSPMAQDASDIFCRDVRGLRLDKAQAHAICAVARYVRSVEESKSLTANPMPKIVISASGMATGGRVLHHLKQYAPDPRNTILFTGFQAGGTRGAAMLAGVRAIKIHGAYVPVQADVENLEMLSGHADGDEIMAWLGAIERPPRRVFIVHGEPRAADALRRRIEEKLGWACIVPDYRDEIDLA